LSLEKRRRFLINAAYWVALLAALYLACKYLIRLVLPFLLALVFSALLRPAVGFFMRRLHLGKKSAALLSVALLYALLLAALVFLGARLIGLAADGVSALPELYSSAVEPLLQKLVAAAESFAGRFDPAVLDFVSEAAPNILSASGELVSAVTRAAMGAASGFAAKLPTILLRGVITAVATLFISLDYDRIADFLLCQLSERAKQLALDFKDSFVQIVLRYCRSYLAIMFITFAELGAGLLALGVKKALLIAALIAVFDIFPIVGAGFVLLPWAAVCLAQGAYLRGAGLALLYAVITVIRQIIEPRIVGRHVGLHPLAALCGMVLGGSLFGVLGLFGVPVLLAILVDLNDSGALRLFKKPSDGRY